MYFISPYVLSSVVLRGVLPCPALLVDELEVLFLQLETVAQILLAHHLVCRQLLGRTLKEYLSFEEKIGGR